MVSSWLIETVSVIAYYYYIMVEASGGGFKIVMYTNWETDKN